MCLFGQCTDGMSDCFQKFYIVTQTFLLITFYIGEQLNPFEGGFVYDATVFRVPSCMGKNSL